jgi:putative hydrolase of the HAD superfamily
LEVVNFANNLTKKYKVAILSNLTISRYLYLRKEFLPNLKLDKMFFSCYLKMRKPDKGIFDYVVNYFKIKPEEVLFIDNMEENIEGAKKLGITAILFDIDSDWKNEIKKVLNKN